MRYPVSALFPLSASKGLSASIQHLILEYVWFFLEAFSYLSPCLSLEFFWLLGGGSIWIPKYE
jgi:hypothetical protein